MIAIIVAVVIVVVAIDDVAAVCLLRGESCTSTLIADQLNGY